MDKMEIWEINEIYHNLQYTDVSSWEQTRWLLYAIIQVNSKKKIDIKKVLQFPWDIDYTRNNLTKTITNDEISKLKTRAKYLIEAGKIN